ncbi:hypothetical protein K431DRAFT_159182 [Polychaeton citri CBS 116435]|uniref:Uncharacterized protein n=1 Tax=Polychaeton citri CBS 116435 TaxID=1314669 RepID=A0A9P4ULH8_9PEZI|nr:hypothetical protein K431DRAFT_159182 [Polychaeton citri CBS 116435]
MRRKFSFDLPRLKIGPLKPDPKPAAATSTTTAATATATALTTAAALKNAVYASPIDSPLEAPKSVRPPLPQHVEADLRAACAYVLQNFKPSHQVYAERFGNAPKPQLDYGAIKASAKQDGLGVDTSAVGTLSKVNTNTDLGSAQEAFDPERLRYRPDVKTEDLFKHENSHHDQVTRSARARAEQLMGGSVSTAAQPKEPHAQQPSSSSHRRSQSTPQPFSNPPQPQQKQDLVIRPTNVPRTDSTDTTGSTPFTDNTDYPNSHHSTAPTSAAITPARSSKRTSTQAFQADHEGNNFAPKVDASEAEWMRKGSTKHKAAQEEEAKKAAQAPRSYPPISLPAMYSQMPARKPVAGSRQSNEVHRPETRQAHDSPASEGGPSESGGRPSTALHRDAHHQQIQAGQYSGAQHSEATARSNGRGRTRSRASSITRDVVRYFRPESLTRQQRSRGDSRARSITREVRDYFRPGTAQGSRKPSMDMQRDQSIDFSRTQTRSQSTDSFRSALSGQAGSTTSGTRKWRPTKPWQKARSGDANEDGGCNGGRPTAVDREDGLASPPRGRRSINLNRELPPLPSLTSWQKQPQLAPEPQPKQGAQDQDQRVRSTQPEDVVALYETSPSHGMQSPGSQRSPHLAVPGGQWQGPKSSTDTLDLLDPDSSLYHTTSMDPTPIGPTTSIDPSDYARQHHHHHHQQSKFNARRDRSIQGSHPPLSGVGYRNTGNAAQNGTHSPGGNSSKSAATTSSRGPFRGLRKKTSFGGHSSKTEGNTPSASNTPLGHSRSNSQQANHPVGKMSSDNDFHRMHDPRYRNIVEITAAPGRTPPQDHKERSRRHWWHSKDKKERDWMEQVARSGSRGGIMLTDEVAGAPIVRY